MLALLLYLLRGYKWQILLIISVGLLSISLSLGSVLVGKEIIDIVTGVTKGNLIWLSIAFMALLGGVASLRLLGISLTNKTIVRMGNAIRMKVFNHLLYTRWQSLKEMHNADVLTRIIKDTDDVVQLLAVSLPNFIVNATQLVASLVLLYIFDATLALMLGVGMPLILIGSRAFYRKMVSYTAEIKRTESDINTLMLETLSNQTIIRTFERQEQEINKLGLIQGKLYQQVKRRIGLTIYGNVMANAAFSGGYAVAFLWSAWGILRGTITFGTMTSFLQLVTRIQKPLSELMSLVPSMISAKAGLDRLVNLLEFQREGYDTPSHILQGSISLKVDTISFRYDEQSPYIYKDFSFSVRSGQMIAIMGETGSGKTTLLRLLLGLIKPDSGRISIQNLEHGLTVGESTRNNFVYVPQGNSLLSGTIRENLLVGDSLADERKLRQVLKIAAADFVWELPDSLDTVVGEQGQGLSEGQAQRIAIARSLLRPGKIILFDEATSALDSGTEAQFLANIRRYLKDKIILFITHNEEVAEVCDEIIHIGS